MYKYFNLNLWKNTRIAGSVGTTWKTMYPADDQAIYIEERNGIKKTKASLKVFSLALDYYSRNKYLVERWLTLTVLNFEFQIGWLYYDEVEEDKLPKGSNKYTVGIGSESHPL